MGRTPIDLNIPICLEVDHNEVRWPIGILGRLSSSGQKPGLIRIEAW